MSSSSSSRKPRHQKMEEDEEDGADGRPSDGFNCCSHVLSPCLTAVCFPCVCCSSWQQINEREEAVVLQWGRYQHTIKEPGIRWINCLGASVQKVSTAIQTTALNASTMVDGNGNPLVVSAVLTYRVVNSFKAAISIKNYIQFVQQQAQATLKRIVSRYPYEASTEQPDELSLKTEAAEINGELVKELQVHTTKAGVKVLTFQFDELSYAPVIAAQMLKRQQAHALVQARSTIVQGSVDTAYDALSEMEDKGIHFSDEAKAQLVTNLLVVMCSDSDATPTISV